MLPSIIWFSVPTEQGDILVKWRRWTDDYVWLESVDIDIDTLDAYRDDALREWCEDER